MNTVTVLAEALLQLAMSDCPAGTTHFAASIRQTCRYASATEVSVSWYRKRKDGGFDEFSGDDEDAGIDAKWMHNDLVKNPIQLYAGEAAMAQESGDE